MKLRLAGPVAHLLAARAAAGQVVSIGVEAPDGLGMQTALYRVLAIERRVTIKGEVLAVILGEA